MEKKTAKTKSTSRRHNTYLYNLEIGGEKVKVSKKMFLDTLDITDVVVFTALGKKTEIGTGGIEKRGKHTGRDKESEKDEPRQHINNMKSLYARKDSKREYLDSSLNLQKIYELYVDIRKKEGCTTPASESTYRSVFNFEFNLSFHRRMKDRCDICAGHENLLTGTDMPESRNYKARVKDNVKKDPCCL